jgi:hypothetical protein
VLLGCASVAVTEAFGFHQQPVRVAFAAILAWVIGFLAIPVPAGAGLRELLFVASCGLSGGIGAAVAAGARVLLILVDGVCGVLGLLHSRRVMAIVGSAAPVDTATRESGVTGGQG